MQTQADPELPIGTQALILSKLYYGVLSKSLETLDTDRYYSILHFIYRNNGCCQQKICNALAIDKTALVKVLSYLSRAGLILKKVNPNDRREQIIFLSKKGEQQTEEIIRAFTAIDQYIFVNLTAQEAHVFKKVLREIPGHLQSLPSNDLFFQYKKTAKRTKHQDNKHV